MKYAVLNKDNKVVNIIEVDNLDDLKTTDKLVKVRSIIYNGKNFYDPKTEKFYEKDGIDVIAEFNDQIPDILFFLLDKFNKGDYPKEINDWLLEYENYQFVIKEEE